MAQKKAHEVAGWLARPDPASVIILCYGPDRGLVTEYARRFAGSTGIPVDDPFSTVRIDADACAEPGLLLTEALTVAMFAARRLVWVRGAGAQKGLIADLKVLSEAPPRDTAILIEASDLKKSAPLRTIIESCRHAMALPCYADEGRALEGLIDDELGKAGLKISAAARAVLRARLGEDRLASRAELQKLALYAAGRGEVTPADIEAAMGDVSAASFDDAIDHMLGGNAASFDKVFTRQCRAGSPPFLALSTALRLFTQLHAMRGLIDAEGKTPAVAVAGARPPIFYSRRNLVEDAVRLWSAADLSRALGKIHAAIFRSRFHGGLAEQVARETLLEICSHAGRLAQRARN